MGVLRTASRLMQAAKRSAQVAKANRATIARKATPGGGATDEVLDAAAPDPTRREFTAKVGQAVTNAAGKKAVNEGSSRATTLILAPLAMASRKTLLFVFGVHEGLAVISDKTTSWVAALVLGIVDTAGRAADWLTDNDD